MKLTAVKVKGKGRKQTWQPPDPQRLTRKRKLEDDDSTGSNRLQRQRLSNRIADKVRTRRKPASPLEQLPTEILERIFLLSGNLNFPRSSLRIGYLLSGRTFHSELIVTAFAPTWDFWYGHRWYTKKNNRFFVSDEAGQKAARGDPELRKLQSDVLACPWMTLDHILNAQQVWYRRRVREAGPVLHDAFRKRPGPGEGGSNSEDNDDGLFDGDVRVPETLAWDEFMAMLETHLSSVSGAPISPEEWLHQRNTWVHHWGAYQSVERNGTRIPNRLLTGPWDWPRVRLLHWLVQGGARLSPDQTWEITKRGFDCLVATMNKDPSNDDYDRLACAVLMLFSALKVFWNTWPAFVRVEERSAIDERRHQAPDLLKSLHHDHDSEQSENQRQQSPPQQLPHFWGKAPVHLGIGRVFEHGNAEEGGSFYHGTEGPHSNGDYLLPLPEDSDDDLL